MKLSIQALISKKDEFLRLDKVQKKPIQTNEFPSFVRQLNLYGFRYVLMEKTVQKNSASAKYASKSSPQR